MISGEKEEPNGANDKKVSMKNVSNEMKINDGTDGDDEVCVVEWVEPYWFVTNVYLYFLFIIIFDLIYFFSTNIDMKNVI